MVTRSKVRQKPSGKRSEKSGFSFLITMLVGLSILAVFSLGAAGALFVCMLPTFVLLLGDSDGLHKMRAQCVGFLNAAALFPYMVDILTHKTTFLTEITNLEMLLVVWGAAFVGTCLQYAAPFVATATLQFIADDKINKLTSKRKKIIEEWGPAIEKR